MHEIEFSRLLVVFHGSEQMMGSTLAGTTKTRWLVPFLLVAISASTGYFLHVWQVAGPTGTANYPPPAAVPSAPVPAPVVSASPPTSGARSVQPNAAFAPIPKNRVGDKPPSPEFIDQQREIHRAQLQSAFKREPVNSKWAAAIQNDLLTAASSKEVADTGEMPTAFRTECRSRSCLVTAIFSENGDADSWAGAYLLGAAGRHLSTAQVLTRTLPDGSTELSIYGSGD
jgi:hypothetical protein